MIHENDDDDAPTLDLETMALTALSNASRLLSMAESAVNKEPARSMALSAIAQGWVGVAQTGVSMLGMTADEDDDV